MEGTTTYAAIVLLILHSFNRSGGPLQPRPAITMAYDEFTKTELEYEFLYNVRNQTLLFLKMCPKTTGLAEEMLTWLDGKVRMLGERLMQQSE